MLTFFALATMLFVTIELSAAWQLYFDIECTRVDGLARGVFDGWKVLHRKHNNMESSIKLIEFMSMWVGNSKIIFSLLLLICSVSNEQKVRILASFCMLFGCVLFYPCMYPALYEMHPSKANEIHTIIGLGFIPMWLFVFIAEIKHFFRYENYQV